MSPKDAMTSHMDKVRELQRERDGARAAFENALESLDTALENMRSARAQRDTLAEALRGVVERVGRFPAFQFMLEDAVEALERLDDDAKRGLTELTALSQDLGMYDE